MDELIAFINARLDEDEATAKAAAGCPLVHQDGHEDGDWSWLRDYGQPQLAQLALIDHQSRFDPARVLREVAAKRAILDEHKAVTRLATLTEQELGFLGWYRGWVLKNLAATWNDHPDYREEWKP